MFAAWGRFVYRARWPVLAGSLLLVAASVYALLALMGTRLISEDGDGSDRRLEAVRASDLLRGELRTEQAEENGDGFVLIFTANDPGLRATDPAFAGAVEAALAPLRGDARIARIDQSPNFSSRDGRHAFVNVTMRAGSDRPEDYAAVRAQVRSDRLRILATGELPIDGDFDRVLDEDLQRAEFVGLPLALLVLTLVFGMVLWRRLRQSSLGRVGLTLALVFGALLIALIPILVGGFAIVGGIAGIFALAQRRDMSVYAINVASMIGLGVAIDYSLFLISRFLDEVAEWPVPKAIERTVATVGKAIVFSGLSVAIGVAGLLFYHSSMLNSMGLGAILVVTTAVVYGLTFLPALLSIAGNGIAARARRRHDRSPARRADGTGVPLGPGADGRAGGFWHTLAGGVMDHPWATLLPLLAILLVAGSPFLRLRMGLGGPEMLPERYESRQGWDLLTTEFPGSETTRITVVVNYPDGQPLAEGRVERLYDYSRWLGSLPNVARVQSPVDLPGPDGRPLTREALGALYAAPRDTLPAELGAALRGSVGEHIVALAVLTPLAGDSDGAHELVERIRAGGGPDPGGAVLVGGRTALTADLIGSIKADTAPAVAFIMLATYLVLFLLLGSVLLPLKAVAMNLLSITASYGALVWIFQDGHLSGWLGFTPGPIDPSVPVLMFCLLFGLSMDYEVLLLSRMQEEFDRGGDNRLAVAEGLEQTGRLITGAAAIMVFVFAAFALADIVIIKSIGLGMALAVAIDALIVRTLLIPATMRLLGELNWWAPGPLARLHKRLGLNHEGAIEPDPQASTASVAATALATASEPERDVAEAGVGRR